MTGSEPGVFVSFDERIIDLAANVASLGFDLADLERRNLLAMDHVFLDRNAIEETGDYDLEGLFIRLAHAIEKVGAKRVVLDSIDSLFAGIPNVAIVRSELSRLLTWFKERRLTVIVTAERGGNSLTRNGVEEYVSDCVIVLDHRVTEQSRRAAAGRQISRLDPWHQRISLPDRWRRHLGVAGDVAGPGADRVERTRVDRDCEPRRDV